MHIVMTSLIAALVICVVLLGVFGLFTRTAFARRIEEAERRRAPLAH
jgi:septation ring formation regulator EzrA